MLKRIKLKTPDFNQQFEIANKGLRKSFTWWQFHPDYETVCQLEDLGCDACHPTLSDILKLTRSYSTLWIGAWQGKVAPMNVVPQGWTYPNGTPLEPEWWWQWHPCHQAELEAISAINTNLVKAMNTDSPLKLGIPFQMQRSISEVSSIDAISLMRLPGLVRKNVEWTFEWE